MTKQEMFEKYGDVILVFSHYYKYTFTFAGVAEDGAKIVADVGGNAEDIYRYDVSNDACITLKQQRHFSVDIYMGEQQIYTEYDY